jgi:hypothetical protein
VGRGLSAQRVDVPQSRKILAEILEGVPDDEQAKIAGGNTTRVYNFDVASLTVRCAASGGRLPRQAGAVAPSVTASSWPTVSRPNLVFKQLSVEQSLTIAEEPAARFSADWGQIWSDPHSPRGAIS